MAQIDLVDELVEAGARLLSDLDQSEYEPESALWYFRPDTGDWVLMLGMSLVRRAGRKVAYDKLQKMLSGSDYHPIVLDDIVIVDNDDRLLQLIRSAVSIGGTSRVRFSRNRIGDAFIEDALLYRLRPTRVAQASG